MKPIKFIHCADLHIDSPFKGIASSNPGLAEILRESTYQSFNKIIDIALAEKVDFVLIAGDIYDSEDKSLRAQLKFRDGLVRLVRAGIPSYVVYGNHDPLNSWSATINWPEGIHRFTSDNVECKPAVKDGEVTANIYGISFARADIKDNLALQFPEAEKSIPGIGLLHANLGTNTGHQPYAPCSIKDLSSKRFEYWALGHVHKHQIIRGSNPAIVYPGCSQSRHPNETGQKGCCLVTIISGQDPDIIFMPADIVRYQRDSVDVSGCDNQDNVIAKIIETCERISDEMNGCHSIVRLSLTGRTQLHEELQKGNNLEDITEKIRENFWNQQPLVWLEKLSLHTAGTYNLDALRGGKDYIADIISICDDLINSDSSSRSELKDKLSPLFSKWIGQKHLSELTPEELNNLIIEARDQILNQLVNSD